MDPHLVLVDIFICMNTHIEALTVSGRGVAFDSTAASISGKASERQC